MHSRGIASLLVVIIVLVLIDLYAYKGVSAALNGYSGTVRRLIRIMYWIVSIGVLAMLAYMVINFGSLRADRSHAQVFTFVALFILFLLPKVVMIFFHGLDDLLHVFRWSWWKLAPGGEASGETLTRSDFLSRIGLIVSVVPFAGVLYGITKGRSTFNVAQVDIPSSRLPAAFHGLRIVQISDMHLGSFDPDSSIVRSGVELINAQEPDLILFTGDMVNDFATEAEPWLPELAKLKARLGKFSILGNHDYSDYARWDDPAAKAANLEALKRHHATIGFRLLLDEHVPIEKDGERIGLLGCQNWGRGFQQYGDLKKTMAGSEAYPFRILMSHDPTHWEQQVWGTGIDLTLSGHTHGAQFGVKIADTTYSPAQWVYKHWAGLYAEQDQRLYVNRGFGFIGFPGRVGMPPEITVLELQRT